MGPRPAPTCPYLPPLLAAPPCPSLPLLAPPCPALPRLAPPCPALPRLARKEGFADIMKSYIDSLGYTLNFQGLLVSRSGLDICCIHGNSQLLMEFCIDGRVCKEIS